MAKIKIAKWIPKAQEFDIEKLSSLKTSEIQRIVNIDSVLTHNPKRVVLSARNSNYIVLDDYRDDPARYMNDIEVLKENIRNIICNNTTSLKESYISYMHYDNGKIYNMSMIHFFFNFVLWRFNFVTNTKITKKDIFMPYNFKNSEYIKYINEKIIDRFRHKFTANQMSELLSTIYDDFIEISEDTGIFLGLSMSMYDLIEKWNTNQEVYDIMHTKLDPNMQLSEAEHFFRSQTARLKEIYLNDPEDNCLKPMFRSETGISDKQLREVLVHQGFKPDLAGFTIPMTSDTNLITEGFNNLQSYTVDAAGARKAGVLARLISKGGYFAKELCKSASANRLHVDPNYVCDTVNYYETTIKNTRDLSELHGRWYLTKNNTIRQILKSDVHLIGKKLKFRSPVTCASTEGICKICYGHMYNQNYGIDVGLNEGLYLSERNYQKNMD